MKIERGDMANSMRTLTAQQATQRMEEHIARAVAALPVTPRLEEQSFDRLPCADPSDNGPLGRVSVGKVYWLRELPIERTTEVFNAMHSYWLSHNYRVLSDQRDLRVPALFVENNDDAFRMSLQANVQGDLTISATSPCVWPNGTPPPDVAGR
ncbi:MAG: hypothetical protein ACRDSP_19550 [Pseudonocardiaceae bacterium]